MAMKGQADLSRVKREKEERSRSTASSVAGVGSFLTIWQQRSAGCSYRYPCGTYTNIVDLHGGGEIR
jgi:hypothetical protein